MQQITNGWTDEQRKPDRYTLVQCCDIRFRSTYKPRPRVRYRKALVKKKGKSL